MPFQFQFIGREKELRELQDSFLSQVVRKRFCLAYLIQGRDGVGKSMLIEEFISSIETTKKIAVELPKFSKGTHVIESDCPKETKGPYFPFKEIAEKISERRKKYRIFKRIGMLVLDLMPWFNIRDIFDDAEKLGDEFSSSEKGESARKEEIKRFNGYIKALNRRSRTAPLIICIRDVQWIDDQSLELLDALIDDERSFWGMIVLEEAENAKFNAAVHTTFNELINKGKMKRLVLRPFQKGYEIELLEKKFGVQLFTTTEFEYIYTLSEGCPRILAALVEDWTRKDWLYEDGSQWKKVSDFEEKIKPSYQKLLDLLITFLQDGELSARERKLIDNFAREWDISEDTVSTTTNMILKSRELGYQIEKRVHTGSIGTDAFLAYDRDMERVIVEYVANIEESDQEFIPREVKHPNLLPSREIKKSNGGVLIVHSYFEGKTLKDLHQEAHETHISKALRTATQIAAGMAELHRNDLVHGFLRPEAIVITNEGEVRLAALDASQLKLAEPSDSEVYICFLCYCSPEQVNHEKIDTRSDIFSFGILFYELLTGDRPFTGTNKGDLSHAIRFEDLPAFETSRVPIPSQMQEVLKKCLQKNPEDRYQHAGELLGELKKLIMSEPQTESPDEEATEEIVTVSESAQPVVTKSTSAKSKILISALTVLVMFFAILVYINFKDTAPKPPKEIVIGHFETDQTELPLDMLKYLITDDLLQSRDYVVLSEDQFRIIHGLDDSQERPMIEGTLTRKGMKYVLTLELVQPNRDTSSSSYVFVDPSELLTGKVREMSTDILKLMGDKPERDSSTFTHLWDAFVQFYDGEKALEKLDRAKARKKFKAALSIDTSFVLAKLRLAYTLRFLNPEAARDLIAKTDDTLLGQLSAVDALRARSLEAGLSGNLRKEIDLSRQIYGKYPARKETSFDVAVAYFGLCDIENAIDYYEKALRLDQNFARAHNHLGYCYSHLGEHGQALDHFRAYLRMDDSTYNAWDSLGDGFMAAGKLDSAAYAKKQGIIQDSTINYLYSSLCYINIRQGKFEEADKNVEEYLAHSHEKPDQANGHYLKALINYLRADYEAAREECDNAIEIYNTDDVVARNHDLHWLRGLVYLELDSLENSTYVGEELRQMKDLIVEQKITATNYRMGIYKFKLHLEACLAAKNGNLKTVEERIKEFDDPDYIKDKVKDHASPFDLAFFNTSFGELFMNPKINRLDLAEERFNKALEYNPNYALAHYNLAELYSQKGDEEKAREKLDSFRELWQGADEDVKALYGIAERTEQMTQKQ